MKRIRIFSLTTAGTLFFTEGTQVREGSLEGFNLLTSIPARFVLEKVLFRDIQCTLGKGNKIRCKDLKFFDQLLGTGAVQINTAELDESKVFDQQEKQTLKAKSSENSQEVLSKVSGLITNYMDNRNQLRNDFRSERTVEVAIESMDEEILIRFEENQKVCFVPVKMKHVDHYFHLVDKQAIGSFINKSRGMKMVLPPARYNLAKKRYEVEAIFPEEVERQILGSGWGTVTLKNLCYLKSETARQYRKIEFEAKANHLGIFKKPFQILSLIYTKNNLAGKVQEILEGYIFKIRTKTDELMKIQLAKIYTPIQNELGAFECREFARKNLIGKQVNIFLKKDEGLNIQGSIIRVSDNKDIENLMIENGFGFVKEELKGTMLSGKLQNLEKKAKQAKKGIHNEKKMGLQLYENFTIHHNKKERPQKKVIIQNKMKFLQFVQATDQGVIEKIHDATTYTIRIDKHKKIIKVKLDGVSKLSVNPKLKQMIKLNQVIDNFTYRNFLQRNVVVDLTQFDQVNNNYIGVLRLAGRTKEKLSLQEILLEEGFVYLSSSGAWDQKWMNNEEKAMGKGLNIWNDRLKYFCRQSLFDDQPKEFKGKLSWVQNGELAYVQPETVNEKLDFIYEQLNGKEKLQPLKGQNLLVGYTCASEYQGQLCRAKILTVTGNTAYISFIDWGNKQTIPLTKLFEIPEDLHYIPPMCCEIYLDIVKPMRIKKHEHLDRLRESMMEHECRIVKGYGNTVDIFVDKDHLNITLVQEGMLKAELTKIHDEAFRNHIEGVMEELRKNLVGVWDVEEDVEEIDMLDYL